ncbi:MAG: ribonuclease III, partial [Lachnospiraceae bacterium]|nr:ribonuclease III [Lachnospiraceae bacterium]
MSNRNLAELSDILHYEFKDSAIIQQAMTHSSFANEKRINKPAHYERIEFLGDAVLECIVSEFLYQKNPGMTEGELTRLRASLVCEFTLSTCAKELKLGEFVRLSKGEELTGGRTRNSILCDLFESVLGAIYLDGGMEPAKRYVHDFLLNDIEHKTLFYDAKSNLQELVQ